ncbi:hypothetical protein [Actinomadura geliboluensis]|uniref:hypothetical protein n=1 Tax=Actinomadura geliboluensis TaxID=882440 RepID=UPI0036AE8462
MRGPSTAVVDSGRSAPLSRAGRTATGGIPDALHLVPTDYLAFVDWDGQHIRDLIT